MKVDIKSKEELARMREACRMSAEIRDLCARAVMPGMRTRDLDEMVKRYCADNKVKASFYRYMGFPGHLCVSVNDEVIHGIPGTRVLVEGDIVSVDVGAVIGGFHGDCAATFACGKISPEAQRLIDVTRQSFFEGIKLARKGGRVQDISAAVQAYVEAQGFSVVREFVGHGIGSALHEAPEVPNYGVAGRGPRLLKGMTLAIEPMVNAGGAAIRQLSDGWTVKTLDGKFSAHYENTILITDGEPEILTAPAI